MNHYKVVLEIEVDAETPLEAAQKIEQMCMSDVGRFTYTVQDDQTDEMSTVDLSEADYKDSVLPLDEYEPLLNATVPIHMVTCEGCSEKIPESNLYCNNCGNENF